MLPRGCCPSCGARFGWRGPRHAYPADRTAPWYKLVTPALSCPSCKVGLRIRTSAWSWLALVLWLLAFASVRVWGRQWLPHFMSAEMAADVHAFSPIFFMGIGSAVIGRIGQSYVVAGDSAGV